MKKYYHFSLIFFLSHFCAIAQSTNWSNSPSCPASARYSTSYFSLNGKGYVCCGYDGNPSNQVWEFNPQTQTWTQKNNFPGAARWSATCFTIGNKGYITNGVSPNLEDDVWEYNPNIDTWTQKGNFPGFVRQDAIGFSIGNKGYVACGKAGGYLDDLWEYNPTNDTWVQKANFIGGPRNGISAFVINNEAYVGIGYNSGATYNDFYKYSPNTNTWTQISDYPGPARTSGAHFTLGNDGYVGAGYEITNYFNDFYKYNASTDTWSSAPSILEHNMFTYPTIFVIGDTAYLGNGRNTQLQYMTEFIKLRAPSNTSITETNNNYTYNIYPNPVSTFLEVDLKEFENVESIIISDLVGKVVYKAPQKLLEKNHLNIQNLNTGTYFCTIALKNNCTYTQKLMLIH